MKPFLILLSCLLLASGSQLHAASDKPNKAGPELLAPFSSAENLKSNFSCYGGPFASYDSWLAMLSKKPKFNTEQFEKMLPRADVERRQQTIDCRVFVYESDGILVEGVMLRPKTNAAERNKLPVVIYNRGGNAKGGTLVYGAVQHSLMPIAELGNIVIASQYRGAKGFATTVKQHIELDQFGGADVNDIKNLLPIINGMADADSARVAMLGASRGGMMSYLAARDMPQLKALIVEAGVADLEASLEVRQAMENIYTRFIPNYATEKTAQLRARSVLHWLDKLPPKLPILLLHGDKDVRVEVAQSQNLAKALVEKGQPHKLVVYPGADHDLYPNRAEADAEIAAWLKQYL
ncbi:alpha/beta hydrolase family protein [Rheinheimera maricola]|uniref:Prolyl oligopeptidase family serine peptidase n=1 Tax=Rheinheimera maricola TaxID=2793282 RepID=A0ABS7XD70_9GAMM|nr:prolyl oligopeptidase family serine peptidase [Rheinheimera maricola]MBZ9613511.1 prolyl oligopeptidase family serine peptidase [Rheinheimera maricola]